MDATGRVFASAVPVSTNVFLGDRSYFKQARATGRFAIGEFQKGRITGKYSLNMAQPIKAERGGEFPGVVFVALDLGWLAQFASRSDLPENSTLTVIDRRGTILVRYQAPDDGRVVVGRGGSAAGADGSLASGCGTGGTSLYDSSAGSWNSYDEPSACSRSPGLAESGFAPPLIGSGGVGFESLVLDMGVLRAGRSRGGGSGVYARNGAHENSSRY